MIRRFVLVFVCGVLALAGSATLAGAQDADRPPNELWDEFPLEPTATPAAAAATPTPTPEVVEVKEPSGGMSPGALIGLVLFAGAVGGLAARVASRRLPPRRPKAALAPAPAVGPPADSPEPPRQAVAPPAAAAPKRPAATPPPPTPKPAVARLPAATPRHAARAQAAAARSSAPAAPAPSAAAKSSAPTTPAPAAAAMSPDAAKSSAPGAAAPRTAPASPPTVAATSPHASTPAPAAPAPPAAGEASAPAARAPSAAPASPRPDAAAHAATSRPAPVRRRRRATPPAAEPPPQPARDEPQSRRFEPAFLAEPDAWETCTITLQTRGLRGRFVAKAGRGGDLVARSPIFPLDTSASDAAFAPPDALDELVGELATAGWRQSAKGPRPWDLRFRRAIDVTRPAER